MSRGRKGEQVFENDPDEQPNRAKFTSNVPKNNPDITQEYVNAKRAFAQFGGRIFDPNDTSHIESGEVTKQLQKFESPLQKYRRLKNEMSSFSAELKQMAASGGQGIKKQQTAELAKQLREGLESMWSQIEQQKGDPKLQKYFKEGVQIDGDTQALMRKIQEFSQPVAGMSLDLGGVSKGKGDKAVYKLFVPMGGSKDTNLPRLSALDQRIAQLEKLLGKPADDMPFADLMSGVDYLRNRLSILSDENMLKRISRSVQELNKEFDKLNTRGVVTDLSKKGVSSKRDADVEAIFNKKDQNKIEDMYRKMKKWDRTVDLLPVIVHRLSLAKGLHEECANIVDDVNGLKETQKRIEGSLKDDKEVLNESRKSLAKNAKIMESNMKQIMTRINKLSQKVGIVTQAQGGGGGADEY